MLLIDELDNADVNGKGLRNSVSKIIALAEKAQQLRQIAESEPTYQQQSVTAVVRRIADRLREDYPDAVIEVETATAGETADDDKSDVQLLALPTLQTGGPSCSKAR